MRFTVEDREDGMLLRQFIQIRLHPSSKMLKALKYKTDGITVNDIRKTVRTVLHTGDSVDLRIDDENDETAILPVDLPIEIVYEDKDIVVPSKPADMPTHPSRGHWEDTVANALSYRAKQQGIPFVFRPINRLDRNTSGLLLVAKNKLSAGRLSDSMKSGKIRKTYLAILDGELKETCARIDKPLHRTKDSIIVREVCDASLPDADNAITDFRVITVSNGHTLVIANPITGRTHQLRVHFSYLGTPITGDDLYGTESNEIKRHALHATVISFPHPTTGKQMTLTSSIPNDFKNLLSHFFPNLTIEEIMNACKEK